MEKRDKWYDITVKLALSLMIIIIVIVAFLKGNPPYKITKELCWLIVLGIILLISDTLEILEIGNIISLRREISQRKQENQILSEDNKELRTQLISIINASINNNSQNQKTDIHMHVQPASSDEKRDNEQLENLHLDNQPENCGAEPSFADVDVSGGKAHTIDSEEAKKATAEAEKREIERHIRSRFRTVSMDYALNKYLEKFVAPGNVVQRDVKFSNNNSNSSSIIDRKVIFDAYIKRPLDELFVEVIVPASLYHLVDTIYYLISEIDRYQKINGVAAKLVLIIADYPDDFKREKLEIMNTYINDSRRAEKMLRNRFGPAIKNGILEIVRIELHNSECQDLLQKSKKTYDE